MVKKYYQIILVVISSRSSIYDEMIKVYWNKYISYLKKNKINIKIIMLYGKNQNPSELNIDQDNIFESISSDSLVPGIINKTIECLRFINENYNYKHIIRTNLSSFFITENMLKISEVLEIENLYGGIGFIKNGVQCISGAGIWLSNSSSRFLVNNYEYNIKNSDPDDVLIGRIFNLSNNVKIENNLFKRKDFINNIYSFKNDLKDYVLYEHYHIRIKNINRNIDIKYMKELTKLLYEHL